MCKTGHLETGINEALQYESADDEFVVNREVIDEEGDVLLRSGIKEFLVSSKVLALASTYFKTMFGSQFSEGRALRHTTDPLPLRISDDDPQALTVVLHTIHFSKQREYWELDVDKQLEVAVLSDKYDCIRALYSDSLRWLQSISAKECTIPSLWKSAIVAHLMHFPAQFNKRVSRLAQVLGAADLDGPLPLSNLPDAPQGK